MRLRHLLLVSTALIAVSPAFAGPEGPQVVGGSANVHGQGSANVTVNQFSQNAIINWHTFNIGAGERTQFVQPNASSVILNRVTGGLGPSQILGSHRRERQGHADQPGRLHLRRRRRHQHRQLPRDHQRHQEFRLHGRPLQLPYSGPAGRLDRQHGDDHGGERRLRGTGRAGRAQLRHHHGDARLGRACRRQHVQPRHVRRQADHARRRTIRSPPR